MIGRLAGWPPGLPTLRRDLIAQVARMYALSDSVDSRGLNLEPRRETVNLLFRETVGWQLVAVRRATSVRLVLLGTSRYLSDALGGSPAPPIREDLL